MSSTLDDPSTGATPRLLLAGFGPYARGPDNPAGRVVERLNAQAWTPGGVTLIGRVIPVSWTGATAAVLDAVAELDAVAVLLLTRAALSSEYRVEMRARNRASNHRTDADGKLWGQARILATGPGVVRVTAPVAEMVEAIRSTGLPAQATSDGGEFVGNFTLYSLLSEFGAGRPVGCLALPDPAPLEEAERAVKAAAEAFAARLIEHRAAQASA
jgi:pyrrolidone-carboxylate peptidase